MFVSFIPNFTIDPFYSFDVIRIKPINHTINALFKYDVAVFQNNLSNDNRCRKFYLNFLKRKSRDSLQVIMPLPPKIFTYDLCKSHLFEFILNAFSALFGCSFIWGFCETYEESST